MTGPSHHEKRWLAAHQIRRLGLAPFLPSPAVRLCQGELGFCTGTHYQAWRGSVYPDLSSMESLMMPLAGGRPMPS